MEISNYNNSYEIIIWLQVQNKPVISWTHQKSLLNLRLLGIKGSRWGIHSFIHSSDIVNCLASVWVLEIVTKIDSLLVLWSLQFVENDWQWKFREEEWLFLHTGTYLSFRDDVLLRQNSCSHRGDVNGNKYQTGAGIKSWTLDSMRRVEIGWRDIVTDWLL